MCVDNNVIYNENSFTILFKYKGMLFYVLDSVLNLNPSFIPIPNFYLPITIINI